jgi:DNA gyrase inhibitor GyrI
MDARIAIFPETKVAAIEHFGPPNLEHSRFSSLVALRRGVLRAGYAG